MSPRLRPGLVVVRRDDRHLQLGLEPPRRALLPDLPEVRWLVETLQRGGPLHAAPPGALAALAQLEAADLLMPEPMDSPGRHARARLTGPRALVEAAAPALRASGLRLASAAAATDSAGDVHVLLGYGALPRELADPLVRDGIAHLAAVLTPWGWELGPFVVPGLTACLRCVDAAHSDHDPRYGVVLDQLARASTPLPMAAPLSTLALAWVARDLHAYRRGERPSTWSATIRLGDSPAEDAAAQHWLRHPHCGCAWDALTG